VSDARTHTLRVLDEQLGRFDRLGHRKAVRRLPDEIGPGETIEVIGAGVTGSATEHQKEEQFVLLVVTNQRLLLLTRDRTVTIGYDRIVGMSSGEPALKRSELKLTLSDESVLEYKKIYPLDREIAIGAALERVVPGVVLNGPEPVLEAVVEPLGEAVALHDGALAPGLEHLEQTVSDYEQLLTWGIGRKSAFKVMRSLAEFVSGGERVVAFCQAKQGGTSVVLVLTEGRLLVIEEKTRSHESFARSDCHMRECKNRRTGPRLTFETPLGERTFSLLQPADEGIRIAAAFGFEDFWNRGLLGDLPFDPGAPPISHYGDLTLFVDRIIDHERRHLPFDGPVQAAVDTAGGIAVTRGRNLAAKGAGTLVLGPLGLLAMGNAKHRKVDSRELYLLVEGPGWSYVREFQPDAGNGLRKFAALLNITAKRYLEQDAPAQTAQAGDAADPVEQLSRLAELHHSGALSDAEFGAAKAKVLQL
jgi:hypothetical protein